MVVFRIKRLWFTLLCIKHVEISEVFQVILEFGFFRCHFCEFHAVSVDSVKTLVEHVDLTSEESFAVIVVDTGTVS